jgi:methylmalonyl-CoA epimerase
VKAVLDHVGVAVRSLEDARAFFGERLGLDVRPPEAVADQQVRVQSVPLGGASIELVAPPSAESPIARFLSRRGPGLHHVTLRVGDLRAALAHLEAQGVRLVDREPRKGADGALVAFVHPSAAHGVLVELTERATSRPTLEVRSLTLGDLRLTTLHDGSFRLDGGAMFGVVPRQLWERRVPADDRHRIQLAMRPLLVEAAWGRLLVDCGAGDKMGPKEADIYALDRTRHLDHALEAAGVTAGSIDCVLATHLHFDHMGGATARTGDACVPRFPAARIAIRRGEWEDATHPHERNRASYLPENLMPLREAGVVDFHDGDQEVRPGVRVVRTGGHTAHHQIVYLESAGRTAVFAADLVPTTAHLQDPWVMGYDLYPVDTLRFKKRFIREAVDREHLVFFEHDPHVAAGYIRERDGKRFVEPVL